MGGASPPVVVQKESGVFRILSKKQHFLIVQGLALHAHITNSYHINLLQKFYFKINDMSKFN